MSDNPWQIVLCRALFRETPFDEKLSDSSTFSFLLHRPSFVQALQSINTLLEKADRVYKTLVAFRPSLEILLLRVYDHGSDKQPTGDPLVDGGLGESKSFHIFSSLASCVMLVCF